ncbi:HAD family hydrolase [Caldinitratiruptor microaerophilus]|uniref:Haloacid dehalogenase n=1 Tax=Caldinitratiruptor microaerophilus TaxID=671077 RepID=A0AA35CNI4_9FIRM|nr:HAD family hydrolase [Caldinitratiruptor microaerophilus]BDG62392.1 haloacid dehalogenase [Caldinitratiruptor microaerophilus]
MITPGSPEPAAQPAPSAVDPARLARIRIVFSDLDETLLGPDHRVGDRSRRAVERLLRLGVEFVVCTGRAPEATRPIVESLGGRYMVCTNGSSVYDGHTLLMQETLPAPLVAEMTAFFHGHGCPVYLMTPVGYLVTRVTPLVEEANRVRGVAPRLAGPEDWHVPAHKVMPWGAAHLHDEALARWAERAQIVYHPDYLEITPRGVTKAWGARWLATRLGFTPDQAAAIGDARNDIELITWAGVGVAMGDGDPVLRAAAKAIAPPHTQDGAAELFEAIAAAHEAARARGGGGPDAR